MVEAAAAGESTPSAAMTAAVAAPTPGSGSYVEVDDEIVVRAPHDAASFAAAAAASAAAAAASAEGDVDEPFLAGKDPEDTPVLPSPAFISRRGPGSAATEAVQLCEEEEAAAPAPRAGRAGELEDGEVQLPAPSSLGGSGASAATPDAIAAAVEEAVVVGAVEGGGGRLGSPGQGLCLCAQEEEEAKVAQPEPKPADASSSESASAAPSLTPPPATSAAAAPEQVAEEQATEPVKAVAAPAVLLLRSSAAVCRDPAAPPTVAGAASPAPPAARAHAPTGGAVATAAAGPQAPPRAQGPAHSSALQRMLSARSSTAGGTPTCTGGAGGSAAPAAGTGISGMVAALQVSACVLNSIKLNSHPSCAASRSWRTHCRTIFFNVLPHAHRTALLNPPTAGAACGTGGAGSQPQAGRRLG